MFGLFRKRRDNVTDNELRICSPLATGSLSSFRASSIFIEDDDKNDDDEGGTVERMKHIIQSRIMEERKEVHNKNPNIHNNRNHNGDHHPSDCTSESSHPPPPPPRRFSTNLMPRHRRIASQTISMDQLQHVHHAKKNVLQDVTTHLHDGKSMREQERAIQHGPARDIQSKILVLEDLEDSQTPEKWMEQMDAAIASKASNHHFPALQLAINTHLPFVQDQRWKFLRAEEWNVERAVDRMARFFELKLEHFGSECLCRELCLQDLPHEDFQLWKETGVLQLLDEKDAAGRPVFVMIGKKQLVMPLQTIIRVSIYLSCITANEKHLQKGGVVQIYWGNDQPFLWNPSRSFAIMQAWKCFPLRNAACLMYYDNEKFNSLFSLLAQEWNPFQTARFRGYHGSRMECIYNLVTLGISRESFPVRDDGIVDLEYHFSFVYSLEIREKAERLLIALGENNNYSNDDFYEPFLTHQEQEHQPVHHVWTDDDNQHHNKDVDPIPLEHTIQEILSPEVIAALNGSSVISNDPLPLETRLSDLEVLPVSFWNRLLRASFARSDSSGGSRSEPSKEGKKHLRHMTLDTVRCQNENLEPGNLIVVPGPMDVIMGRGRHNKNKPGNRKLQAMLEEHFDEYEAADKNQKTILAENILNTMKAKGSRFLVRQGEKKHGVWIKATHANAREKISHDFRNMRRTHVKKKSGSPSLLSNEDGDTGEVAKRKRRRALKTSNNPQDLKRPLHASSRVLEM